MWSLVRCHAVCNIAVNRNVLYWENLYREHLPWRSVFNFPVALITLNANALTWLVAAWWSAGPRGPCTDSRCSSINITVYPKKYAHGFVVLCFVVVMQSFIMNSNEVFIHIHQGCFAGTGAIVRLPQCQWSKPDGYGKISQCITTTKHSKAKTVCIFLEIYCTFVWGRFFKPFKRRFLSFKDWHYYIHLIWTTTKSDGDCVCLQFAFYQSHCKLL